MDEATNARFLERLRRHDEAAFDELLRTHGPRIRSVVERLIGDAAEAEDLTQEVFVSVFKAIGEFRGDSKLSTWIHRIAINHCHNRRKYLGRRARPGKEAWDDDAHEDGVHAPLVARVARPDEAAEGNEAERMVRTALAALAEDHRVLVVLRDLEGLAYDEIQTITGLPEGTVKSKLHRARAELVKELERLRSGSAGSSGSGSSGKKR